MTDWANLPDFFLCDKNKNDKKNVSAVDGVMIGHVDCTAGDNINKELCNSNGVNGFPTLNIYKDGVKVSNTPYLLSSTHW